MKKSRWWKEKQQEVARKSIDDLPRKPMTLSDLPELFTAKQVAEYFGVNVFTVYHWKADGLIKGEKMNRHVRFTADQIAECKAKREALANG